MDRSEQETFRPLIEARLAEIETALTGGADDRAAISPDVSIGRLSRLDSMQMQQMALAGKRRLEQEQQRLRQALRRVDSGTYGRCQLCQKDIHNERLRHLPDAATCVPCLERAR